MPDAEGNKENENDRATENNLILDLCSALGIDQSSPEQTAGVALALPDAANIVPPPPPTYDDPQPPPLDDERSVKGKKSESERSVPRSQRIVAKVAEWKEMVDETSNKDSTSRGSTSTSSTDGTTRKPVTPTSNEHKTTSPRSLRLLS